MQLALQDVVDQVLRLAEVVEDVTDTVIQRLRHDSVVAPGNGTQGVGIERVVETEYDAVDRLPGVGVVEVFLVVVTIDRQRGRGHRQGQQSGKQAAGGCVRQFHSRLLSTKDSWADTAGWPASIKQFARAAASPCSRTHRPCCCL